jgi:hypothetical protein
LAVLAMLIALHACSRHPPQDAQPLDKADIRRFMATHYGPYARGKGWLSADDSAGSGATAHNICASLNINTGSRPHLLMAVCQDSEEPQAGLIQGSTDFFDLEKIKGAIKIRAQLEHIKSGTQGSANPVRVVRLGQELYAFEQTGSAMYKEQGCGGNSLQYYSVRDDHFVTLLNIVQDSASGDSYTDGIQTDNHLTLTIDSSHPERPAYPLDIAVEYSRWNQNNPAQAPHTTHKAFVLQFNNRKWRYELPAAFTPLAINC